MSFLHRVTGTGWGAGTFRVSSKESHCSFVLKEVSWGGLVIWLGCLLGSSLWRFSWARPLGGDPRVDPEIAGGIIYLLFSEHLGIPKEEQESIAWEMNAWNTLLSLLPPWPSPRFFLEEKWKIIKHILFQFTICSSWDISHYLCAFTDLKSVCWAIVWMS